jgi:hypothetical protein
MTAPQLGIISWPGSSANDELGHDVALRSTPLWPKASIELRQKARVRVNPVML